jgi:hypothetical protein
MREVYRERARCEGRGKREEGRGKREEGRENKGGDEEGLREDFCLSVLSCQL